MKRITGKITQSIIDSCINKIEWNPKDNKKIFVSKSSLVFFNFREMKDEWVLYHSKNCIRIFVTKNGKAYLQILNKDNNRFSKLVYNNKEYSANQNYELINFPKQKRRFYLIDNIIKQFHLVSKESTD